MSASPCDEVNPLGSTLAESTLPTTAQALGAADTSSRKWPELRDAGGTAGDAEPEDAGGKLTSRRSMQFGTSFRMRTSRQSPTVRVGGSRGKTVECTAAVLDGGLGAAPNYAWWRSLHISFSICSRNQLKLQWSTVMVKSSTTRSSSSSLFICRRRGVHAQQRARAMAERSVAQHERRMGRPKLRHGDRSRRQVADEGV
ncbi:unnamed protein product [Urochloa humidicola]